MNPPSQDDFFERYESPYARDLEGRLIRIEAPTLKDLETIYTVKIDGVEVKVPKAVPSIDDQGVVRRDLDGRIIPRLTTIYDAASRLSSNPIPVLCHQEHVPPVAVCRVCCVLTKGGEAAERLWPACQHPIQDGMEVYTSESDKSVRLRGSREEQPAGPYVKQAVKMVLELLASNHLYRDQPADDCRYQNELLALSQRFEIVSQPAPREVTPCTALVRRPEDQSEAARDTTSRIIDLDHNHCILCDRCVRACSEVKPFKIIGHTGYGNKARISFDLGEPMGDSGCVACGECAVACPTGALTFKPTPSKTEHAWEDMSLRPTTIPAEALRHDPLFAGVPYAYLKWMEGAVGKLVADRELVLCRQGEYGATAFYIKRGAVTVEIDGTRLAPPRTAHDIIVGEMACMSHQPRNATLYAEPRSEIWVIRRNMLHVLQRNQRAREILHPAYQQRALETFLARGVLFKGLSPDANAQCIKILRHATTGVQLVEVDPGQAVFLQGAEADGFYIINRGHVKVTERKPNGEELTLGSLAPGYHFGEIGLLSRLYPEVTADFPEVTVGRRMAACIAMDHVELIEIGLPAFTELTSSVPEFRDSVESILRHLLNANRRTREQVGDLLGEFLAQGLYQGQNLLVLDLKKCTRCQECVKACSDSHHGVTRLILEGNRLASLLVPSACRSCHDPLCLVGCPVDAIHRRPVYPNDPSKKSLAIVIETTEGKPNRCIGCGLCSYNCPFGSIHMIPDPARPNGFLAAVAHGGASAEHQSQRLATNCDLCESLDGDPRCVRACPHDAAHRQTGYALAEQLGLNVRGPAPVEPGTRL